MQFYQPINNILGQESKVKLLRFLSQYNGQFTGRELARLNSLSHPIVHKSLSQLEEQGLILIKKLGQASLYSLNQKNYLNQKALKPLFQIESQLKKRVFKKLINKLDFKILSIILFGSMSQKKEKASSDIDFLIIIPNKTSIKKIEAKILNLSTEIAKKFGNQLSPIILKLSDFAKKIQKKDKLVNQIITKGHVVYGQSLTELFINAKNSIKKTKQK